MVAGGREVWATDRKRVMELSQHCWFCSALIKLCWRATDRLRAPIENSRELLIKAVSSQRSCPSIRYFLKGTVLPLNRQSAVFLNVTNPPKKVSVPDHHAEHHILYHTAEPARKLPHRAASAWHDTSTQWLIKQEVWETDCREAPILWAAGTRKQATDAQTITHTHKHAHRAAILRIHPNRRHQIIWVVVVTNKQTTTSVFQAAGLVSETVAGCVWFPPNPECLQVTHLRNSSNSSVLIFSPSGGAGWQIVTSGHSQASCSPYLQSLC